MKILVELLNIAAQLFLELLIIIPILKTLNFVNKKLPKGDVRDNSNTCKLHSYMPKWDKIFLCVYLRQLLHGPNMYEKQLTIHEASP